MSKASFTDPETGAERRLASVSVPLGEVNPGALLRAGEGEPRGFWAREGRWFAHRGEVGRIEVTDRHHSPDRFEQAWAQARTLLSCTWKDPGARVNPPSPRLFGGFSFGEDHQAVGPWEGFPSARFILPEIELMGGEGSRILTLRRFVPQGEHPGMYREEMESTLDGVRDELLSVDLPEEATAAWIPATRGETDQGSWEKAVERALVAVEEGALEKIVMARVQSVSVDGTLDPVEVVMNLWGENPGSHVFLFEPVAGRAILGAPPETVATVSGGKFRATAVAGSIARGRGEEGEERSARALLESRKDRREQQVCVEYMLRRLQGLGKGVHAEDEPHVLTLAAIQHLETAIEAELHPEENVLSALAALHPTPAVCGVPRDAALDFLEEIEPFARGWYAGPVGWFDGDGNGVFVPALRSAVGEGGEWRLFAGAGIVAGSDPAREWDETRIKFQPVLKALSGARPRKAETPEGP